MSQGKNSGGFSSRLLNANGNVKDHRVREFIHLSCICSCVYTEMHKLCLCVWDLSHYTEKSKFSFLIKFYFQF